MGVTHYNCEIYNAHPIDNGNTQNEALKISKISGKIAQILLLSALFEFFTL
jgi:hypothetical protein